MHRKGRWGSIPRLSTRIINKTKQTMEEEYNCAEDKGGKIKRADVHVSKDQMKLSIDGRGVWEVAELHSNRDGGARCNTCELKGCDACGWAPCGPYQREDGMSCTWKKKELIGQPKTTMKK